MHDVKIQHKKLRRVENAELENAAQKIQSWKMLDKSV